MSSSPSPQPRTIRVLFVCLGNICRSPMAHGIFASQVSKLPSTLPVSARLTPTIILDSAGTGAYHVGSDPDPRTMTTLRKHGIHGFEHAARKIKVSDFRDFDYVLAMDEENLEDLKVVKKRAEREVRGDVVEKGTATGTGKRSLGATAVGSSSGSEEGNDGGDGLARLCMFGDFGGRENEVIDDPWYGGGEGFEVAYKQCLRFSRGLLDEILGEHVDVE